MDKGVAGLYHEQYVARSFERLEMFKLLAQHYGAGRVLYAGSFAHITPSFVFASVVYVDDDKRARAFFANPALSPFIAQHKAYPQDASVTFYAADYRQGFPEPAASFDLLISQYAGFVGHYCKRYLKVGGVLVVNDSHGDAGMAALDGDYALDALLTRRGERYRLTRQGLDEYFVTKAQIKNPDQCGLFVQASARRRLCEDGGCVRIQTGEFVRFLSAGEEPTGRLYNFPIPPASVLHAVSLTSPATAGTSPPI